jgi:hypothetical protein
MRIKPANQTGDMLSNEKSDRARLALSPEGIGLLERRREWPDRRGWQWSARFFNVNL